METNEMNCHEQTIINVDIVLCDYFTPRKQIYQHLSVMKPNFVIVESITIYTVNNLIYTRNKRDCNTKISAKNIIIIEQVIYIINKRNVTYSNKTKRQTENIQQKHIKALLCIKRVF